MKNNYFMTLLLVVLFAVTNRSYGQQSQREMSKHRMLDFYKKTLNVDSVKANQVLQIMLNYKLGVTQTASSQKLDADAKSIPTIELEPADTLKLNKKN
jgi:hypothetical protein